MSTGQLFFLLSLLLKLLRVAFGDTGEALKCPLEEDELLDGETMRQGNGDASGVGRGEGSSLIGDKHWP
jgi:hypothetical protein